MSVWVFLFFLFTDFDDSQKVYSHSGANIDWIVRLDRLNLGKDSDNIWHECTFLLAQPFFFSSVSFFALMLE